MPFNRFTCLVFTVRCLPLRVKETLHSRNAQQQQKKAKMQQQKNTHSHTLFLFFIQSTEQSTLPQACPTTCRLFYLFNIQPTKVHTHTHTHTHTHPCTVRMPRHLSCIRFLRNVVVPALTRGKYFYRKTKKTLVSNTKKPNNNNNNNKLPFSPTPHKIKQ